MAEIGFCGMHLGDDDDDDGNDDGGEPEAEQRANDFDSFTSFSSPPMRSNQFNSIKIQ